MTTNSLLILILIIPVACRSVVLVPGASPDTEDTSSDGGDTADTTPEATDTPTADSDIIPSDTDTLTESLDSSSATETGCAPADMTPLVCHDFENGLTGTYNQLNGTISIDTLVVHRGLAAMKSETTATNSIASLTSPFLPIETGTVYFRVHVFIPTGALTGTVKVVNLSGGNNGEAGWNPGVDVNLGGDRSVNIYQHANYARFTSPPGMIPENEWFCIRGSYSISATSGATLVWVNDNLAVSTTASQDAIINGGVSRFETGIGWTEGGQNATAFHFDDVLVATTPVECL